MCQHNLPCSIVYAHCLLPGRAFASLYILLFLEKEAEIGGRVLVKHVIKIIIQDYFSLIKLFIRDGEMLLYKYYIPCAGDSRKYHPAECDYQPRRRTSENKGSNVLFGIIK